MFFLSNILLNTIYPSIGIDVTPILIIFMLIIIATMIPCLVIQIKKNKRNKRNRVIIFLTSAISALGFFLIGGQLTYYPAINRQEKLNENINYKISTNENINNLTITINFLTDADFFEYEIFLYDKKDNLIIEHTDKLTNFSAKSYKILTFDKPTNGSYQFKYKCYDIYHRDAYFEDNQKITSSVIIGLIFAFITFILIKIIEHKNNNKIKIKDKNYTFCTNCGSKNILNANYCNNCGNKIIKLKEETNK